MQKKICDNLFHSCYLPIMAGLLMYFGFAIGVIAFKQNGYWDGGAFIPFITHAFKDKQQNSLIYIFSTFAVYAIMVCDLLMAIKLRALYKQKHEFRHYVRNKFFENRIDFIVYDKKMVNENDQKKSIKNTKLSIIDGVMNEELTKMQTVEESDNTNRLSKKENDSMRDLYFAERNSVLQRKMPRASSKHTMSLSIQNLPREILAEEEKNFRG